MKIFKKIYQSAFMLGLMFWGSACEEQSYEVYEPEMINADATLVVYEDLASYPVIGEIVTSAPEVALEQAYGFVLDSVAIPEGSQAVRNKFTIDKNSGVITYENAGELSPGVYTISVGLTTLSGLYLVQDAVSLEIEEVPATIATTSAAVDVQYLQTGAIATLSVEDNSEGLITDSSIQLISQTEGFAYDNVTNELIKSGTTTATTVQLGFKLETNLGIKQFENFITVNIGDAPTLAYLQQDGGTTLSAVTLSPWTAYTTSAPALEGMEAGGGFQVILPAELADFDSYFSFDAQGRLSIAEAAGMPEGEFSIGVTATTSGGIEASFEELFIIKVEAKWDTDYFIDDQLNEADANVAPEVAYPGEWSGYSLNGGSAGLWSKVTDVGAGAFSGMRRFNPKDTDAGLVRSIDVAGVYGLRISFAEMIGYGGAFTNNYDRALYYGDDLTNVAAGNFVSNEWNTLMDIDGLWQGVNWNGGAGPANVYTDIEIDMSQVAGDQVHIMWRMLPSASSSLDQNGQWILDYFKAQKASAYPAIEE